MAGAGTEPPAADSGAAPALGAKAGDLFRGPALTAGVGGQRPGPCIVIKAHRRFRAFAHAMCTHRTIGVCFGPASGGKTLSGRRHAHWELAEPLLHPWGPGEPADAHV